MTIIRSAIRPVFECAVALIGLAVVTPCRPAAAQAKPDPLATIDAYIEKSRTDWRIPGLAVAIVRNDSVIFAKGYGLRELGKVDKVDDHTLFAIGSNTKSFTSTAAAMLVDDGKLSWNDRVTKWLPWFRLYDPYATRELTLRDVLSHRSGLGRRADMVWYASNFSRDEVIRRIRFLPPNAPFRTEMGYQNIMVSTGGEIVGAAAGMPYDEVIAKRIFEPLGMTQSTTTVRDLASRSDVATPHQIAKEEVKPIPHRNLDNVAPAGSIYSSVAEMAQYLRFQLGRGTYNGKKLVSAFMLDQTWTPHINAGGAGDSLNSTSAYGMGWVLTDYRGHRMNWHNGGIDGMLSEMWALPDDHIGIVVLTNGSPHAAGPPIVRKIADLLMGWPTKDYTAETLGGFQKQMAAAEAQEKATEAARVKDSHPALPVEQFAGTYADSLYGSLEVSAEGGTLHVRFGGLSGELSHWQYNTFKWETGSLLGRTFVTFQIDPMGKAAEADVDNLTRFRRKDPAKR